MENDFSIAITGNPVDGFTYYGVFACRADAIAWTEDQIDCEWWVADLETIQGN